MNKLPVVDNKSELEEFESLIFMSEIEQIAQATDDLAVQIRDQELLYQRLSEVTSKHVGYPVNKDTVYTVLASLPHHVQGEILDEVANKQNCLIRPSHSFMPYSLVGQKQKLNEYVPDEEHQSPLQLLSNRATSRAFEILKEYTSDNTYRAHMGDLVYIQAWLSAIGFSFYEPISEKELLTFIVQHAEGLESTIDKKLVQQGYKSKLGPHKLATIKRRVASLSIFAESVKWPNPCNSTEVKSLLAKLTKKYGTSRPAGKAITKDILDDMLDTCKDTLIDIRDRALLLFAWGSGGRRQSEVIVAQMKDLTKTPLDEFVYTIARSKTDQEAKGAVVPIKGRVAKALTDWLTASGITEGEIFRAVAKGGKLRGALSDMDLYRIVKVRLKKAGYDETQFGAHSLRSGFVTEAGRRGKPLGDVMQLTTHRNVSTVMKYYQAGNISNNSAANLAD
jgi:integrase